MLFTGYEIFVCIVIFNQNTFFKVGYRLFGYFNLPSKEYVDQLLTQKVISMIFASIFGLIDLFVFKNLYDKYCNHSNITAYKTNIVIPAELKALNNIGDLPD